MLKRKILEELFILKGSIEESSLIDNKVLENNILTDYTKLTINPIKPNKYNDLQLTYNKNQTWVIENIIERIQHDYPSVYALETINIFANLEGYLESSYKRNHDNSDFTAIYLVKGFGELIFEWDSNTRGKKDYIVNLKEKEYLFFNSNLNYYFTKNPNRDLIRSYITINFKDIK